VPDRPTPADPADRTAPGGAARLILASASPRRRDLLARAGYAVEVRPADVDEARSAGEGAEPYVARLAIAKAEAGLRAAVPDAGTGGPDATGTDAGTGGPDRPLRVLGADTVVVAPDGEVLGKPSGPAEARRMLRALAGRTHHVLTAVAVAAPGRPTRHLVARTEVTFAPLDDDAIERYLATGEPFDKAGAYGIQGEAGAFVTHVEGSVDTVIGLPVGRLGELLS